MIKAWDYIINNWYCIQWNPLPEWVKSTLHLDSRLGMINGTLVTRQASQGMREFINRLNHKES